jgi:hypothetical protein
VGTAHPCRLTGWPTGLTSCLLRRDTTSGRKRGSDADKPRLAAPGKSNVTLKQVCTTHALSPPLTPLATESSS